MSSPGPGFDVSQAVRSISSIGLTSMAADRRPFENLKGLRPAYRRSCREFQLVGPTTLVVRPVFSLHGYPSDGSDEEDWLIRISATYEVVYEIDELEGFGEESIAAFSLMNGLFNAWPYWREFVHSATQRLGLPGLIAPILRVDAMAKEQRQKNTLAAEDEKPHPKLEAVSEDEAT